MTSHVKLRVIYKLWLLINCFYYNNYYCYYYYYYKIPHLHTFLVLLILHPNNKSTCISPHPSTSAHWNPIFLIINECFIKICFWIVEHRHCSSIFDANIVCLEPIVSGCYWFEVTQSIVKPSCTIIFRCNWNLNVKLLHLNAIGNELLTSNPCLYCKWLQQNQKLS